MVFDSLPSERIEIQLVNFWFGRGTKDRFVAENAGEISPGHENERDNDAMQTIRFAAQNQVSPSKQTPDTKTIFPSPFMQQFYSSEVTQRLCFAFSSGKNFVPDT